jgi:quercetin 2,3-dioxygenase
VIRPGDVQVMSAGTGIQHSEFNHSKTEPVHFLQIWVLPDREGLPPRYDQKNFPQSAKRGQLRLVGSPGVRDDSIVIHQDVEIYDALLGSGDSVTHALASGRKSWLQIVGGSVEVNGTPACAGDGLAIRDETLLTIKSRAEGSELLVFDLP